MKTIRDQSMALAITLLGANLAVPAQAQDTESPAMHNPASLEEVVVTARRREELLQDVPISMTVFNQQTAGQWQRRQLQRPGAVHAFARR